MRRDLSEGRHTDGSRQKPRRLASYSPSRIPSPLASRRKCARENLVKAVSCAHERRDGECLV